MGKEGFLTPKAIANQIKSKGLQKLRWYCQMCQKQCRDENGFKCHTTSESHQRQLLLVAESPGKFVDQFSKEFHISYMDFLRRVYGGRRIEANVVYQEYIKDRDHVHMNGTRWTTLTGYVQWLGREGLCIVDQTEKGWFVQAIDRDPDTIIKNDKQRKKEKMQKSDGDREIMLLQKQINRCKEVERQKNDQNDDECIKELPDNRTTVKFPIVCNKKEASIGVTKSKISMLDELNQKSNIQVCRKRSSNKISALQEIIFEEKAQKISWIHAGIIVKVIESKCDNLQKGSKPTIIKVDQYNLADLLCSDGSVISGVNPQFLRSVIPAIGRQVLVLNGIYRGKKAELLSLDENNFCVDVKLSNGKVLKRLPYADISKYVEINK